MNKIAIVTDAWHPQINGVVTTLSQMRSQLQLAGHQVLVVNPQEFRSIPCPTYPEIRLSLVSPSRLYRTLAKFAPHAVHIATEGPLGWLARSICRRRNFHFTTSYHTRFPEYLRLRAPIPLCLSYAVVRAFHRPAARVMVATEALQLELAKRRFANLVHWSRGVDTDLFRPRDKSYLQLPRPVYLFVGRVAVEKNLEALLRLHLPGTVVVVGDGPAKQALAETYPRTRFVGYRRGEELARYLAAADVFVFPSRTDTFGVAMLEAMACGVPVAAYPVTGPINVVRNGVNGWLDEDLAKAITRALAISPESCRNSALKYSWQASSRQFFNNLAFADQPLS